MNGNANVCEVAPAIKGGISLTLSSCQIHHCQGWLPVFPMSHQLHRGSAGVKEEALMKKAKEEESICVSGSRYCMSVIEHTHRTQSTADTQLCVIPVKLCGIFDFYKIICSSMQGRKLKTNTTVFEHIGNISYCSGIGRK